jgi:uncharacterized protein RhaS with RHS repeats
MKTITNDFWSLVDRYYDPATDQFLSVDPLVAETGQPYAYTADDPVNGTDPLGLITLVGGGSAECNSNNSTLYCTGAEPNGASVAGSYNASTGASTGAFACNTECQFLHACASAPAWCQSLHSLPASSLGAVSQELDVLGGGVTGWNAYSNSLGESAAHASPESLEALAESGTDAADVARVFAPFGVALTFGSDIYQGHSAAYAAGDAGSTFAGAEGGAAAGAAICSETGPGAVVCAGVGAFIGGGGAHWIWEQIAG